MADTEPNLLRRGDALLAADTRAWGLPTWTRWWLLGLPFVACLALILAAPHPRLYHALIEEDHVIEWAQFAAILAASIVFGLAGFHAWRNGRRGLAILFALVAVGSFVVAGEEISWGQRILGLQTPEALDEINHQGETNIHNINGVQKIFNLGEMLVGLYGFGVPILLSIAAGRRLVRRSIDRLLVPPLAFSALFFLPFLYRAFRAFFLPEAGERITEFGEVPELTLYVGILLTGAVILRSLRRARPVEAA